MKQSQNPRYWPKYTQAQKTKFRNSKQWKTFRKYMKNKQQVDPISNRPLTTRCCLHHRNLDPEKYESLSDESHFRSMNPMTHKTLHYLYTIAVRDGLDVLLERIRTELQAMIDINQKSDAIC